MNDAGLKLANRQALPAHASDRRRRLVLGTFTLAEAPQEVWDAVLDEYVAEGGEWVDTAFAYGRGQAESKLGCYMRRRNPPLKISTKVGHFAHLAAYRVPGLLTVAFGQACERLGRTPDQVLLHEADWLVWWQAHAKPLELLAQGQIYSAPCLDELREICRTLSIRWGISGNNAGALSQAAVYRKPAVVLAAKQYDLLWRSAESLVSLAAQAGFELWLGSPFHQSWLFRLKELAAFGERHNVDIAQGARALAELLSRRRANVVDLAIPFLLDRNPRTRIVVGVREAGEITQVLKAAEASLPDDLALEIEHMGFHAPPMLPSVLPDHASR